MSDSDSSKQTKTSREDESSASSSSTSESKTNSENEIASCAGGLTEKQARELQEELDRAKEDNSFSSSSRCLIS